MGKSDRNWRTRGEWGSSNGGYSRKSKHSKNGCASTAIGLIGGSAFGIYELVRTIVS